MGLKASRAATPDTEQAAYTEYMEYAGNTWTAENNEAVVRPRPRPARGRHRKPRPRRRLFAVGGLALVAGALSFVRLVPESAVGPGGAGVTEAEPRAAAAGVPEGAANAAATLEAVLPPAGSGGSRATAGRTRAGSGTSPGARTMTAPGVTSTAPAATAPPPGSTGIPTAPFTRAPRPTATTPPTAPSTTAPAPRPDHPDGRDQHEQQDFCVPVIGLCVEEDSGSGDGPPG